MKHFPPKTCFYNILREKYIDSLFVGVETVALYSHEPYLWNSEDASIISTYLETYENKNDFVVITVIISLP